MKKTEILKVQTLEILRILRMVLIRYILNQASFFIKYFIYSKLKLEKKKMYSDNNKYTTTNSQKTEQSDNSTKTKPSQQK